MINFRVMTFSILVTRCPGDTRVDNSKVSGIKKPRDPSDIDTPFLVACGYGRGLQSGLKYHKHSACRQQLKVVVTRRFLTRVKIVNRIGKMRLQTIIQLTHTWKSWESQWWSAGRRPTCTNWHRLLRRKVGFNIVYKSLQMAVCGWLTSGDSSPVRIRSIMGFSPIINGCPIMRLHTPVSIGSRPSDTLILQRQIGRYRVVYRLV